MASVAHPFHSAVSDGTDASLVRPSNWNADHTVTGYQESAEKGAASGYAPLDSGILVPIAYLPVAVPAIVLGSSAAAGSATTIIRSDSTIAAFDATSPTTQAFGDSAVVGTVAKAARRDHKHAMPADPSATFASPTIALASSAAGGAAPTVIRSDATIAAFDATSPTTQAYSDSPAVGSAAFAARRDHKHGMPASSGASGGTPAVVLGSSATAGSAGTFLRTDDTIAAFDATNPTTQAYSDSPSVGTAAKAARRDHLHGMPASAGASFATPAVVLGSSAAAGAAGTVIRSDSTIAAFDATAPVTQAFSDAAAVGSAAFAARRDHKHGMPASPGADPWTTISKSADQTRTNDAVLFSDTELTFAMDATSGYIVQFFILYSANNSTGKYAWGILFSAAASVDGWYSQLSSGGGNTLQGGDDSVAAGHQWPFDTIITAGSDGTDANIRGIQIPLIVYNRAGGTNTVTWQFANAAASSGRTSTTRAKSMLRYRKLA